MAMSLMLAAPGLTWHPGAGAQGWLEIHRGAFSVFDDRQQRLGIARCLQYTAAGSVLVPAQLAAALIGLHLTGAPR